MSSQECLIECIPNFSEGRNPDHIAEIASSIRKIKGVKLLHVDPGYAAHRTVMTFAGPVEEVIRAAFAAIQTASQVIDMRNHQGTHPRMGATDVCPLVPISGISIAELIPYAQQLGKRVGEELGIPVYMYEETARAPHRKNLADIRSGEYEGFQEKIAKEAWKPDYGPTQFNAKAGQTVIGVRDFLVAYNMNLNTDSVKLARSIAFDIREIGRVKKVGGIIQRDAQGNALRIPGTCKSLKAIGWFIDEYQKAQVSTNLTRLEDCSVHQAFEAAKISATARGVEITGSELIGLIPKKCLLDAGVYYAEKTGEKISKEKDLILLAIKHLGLDELAPFDPKQRILEYVLEQEN